MLVVQYVGERASARSVTSLRVRVWCRRLGTLHRSKNTVEYNYNAIQHSEKRAVQKGPDVPFTGRG